MSNPSKIDTLEVEGVPICVVLALALAALVSWTCHTVASTMGEHFKLIGADKMTRGSALFLDGILVYLYPIPLVLWALVESNKEWTHRKELAIISATFAITIFFIVLCAVAACLPFYKILVIEAFDKLE